jgi:hypothetical protein
MTVIGSSLSICNAQSGEPPAAAVVALNMSI